MGKKAKSKNKVSYRTEEQQEVIKLVILIVVIAAIVAGIYFLTRIFVTKDFNKKSEPKTEEVIEGTINYNVTIIGSLLDRPYTEYYVMMYDSSTITSGKYQAVYSAYMSSKDKDSLKMYYVDLSNIMNKPYVASEDEKTNPEAQSIDELKLGEFTLVKIKKGKIVKYIEGLDDIKKELKIGD